MKSLLFSFFVGAATVAGAQTLATGDARTLTKPVYPELCEVVTAHYTSAARTAPPSDDDTARIQKALKACAGTGLSVALVASGDSNAFYTSALNVQGEALLVDAGVTLYGVNRYAKQASLIHVTGDGAAVLGGGVIDGRGDLLSTSSKARLVQASDVTNFVVADLTLTQSLHPNLYIEGGNGATVYNLTILTPAHRHNADGIDIDSIKNVTVYGSSINAGDDGIAIKTNSGPTSNITVTQTRVYGSHGLSIGSQTMYGVTNVLFSDNYVYGVDKMGGATSTNPNAINIKTDYACGGTVEQVTYRNTCIKQAKHLIVVNANYGACKGKTGTPVFKDIVIDGVRSVNSLTNAYSRIVGYDASDAAQVYLAHISLDNTTQSGDTFANVYLDQSNITPIGVGVTSSLFSIDGAVPVCNF